MFDALTHLYRCPDPALALKVSEEAGVTDVLIAGVEPGGWVQQSDLAGPGVHTAYGLHPWTAAEPDGLKALARALDTLAPPVAVGEIGLDGSRAHRHRLKQQEAVFLAQLDLARQRDLPVILHIVRAHGAALACFDQCPAPGGMVHGFSGHPEVAREWLRRGMSLSYGRLLCDPSARRARASAAITPLNRLLIETDSPDQLQNPADLPLVLAALSAIRALPLGLLAAATAENACRLFRLPVQQLP